MQNTGQNDLKGGWILQAAFGSGRNVGFEWITPAIFFGTLTTTNHSGRSLPGRHRPHEIGSNGKTLSILKTESLAENYFAKFAGPNATSVLSGLPATHPKTFEDNWLDFKSGQVRPEDLEAIWSKAIGAMANAGGGVVVWGIKAAKHGNPAVDAAESLDLVPDVNVFASRLNEISHFSTDPPIAGIEIRPIPQSDTTKEGFVVCFIPEGTTKPYQSLRSKKPFYLRIGDESKEPPLPILRQLFNPHLTTRAKLRVTHAKQQGDPNNFVVFSCKFTNTGDTSIKPCTISVFSDGMPLSFAPTDFSPEPLFKPLEQTLHPSMTVAFQVYSISQTYVQQPIYFTLFQEDQQSKANHFYFDFGQGRFIREGLYHFNEMILEF